MSSSPPLIFVMPVASYDVAKLPANARDVASAAFRNAVSDNLLKDFAVLGGRLEVVVDQRIIQVKWTPGADSPDPFEAAIKLMQQGKLREGVPILETLLQIHPEDPEILLNLGMALSDLAELDRAIELLKRRTELMADNANGWTALGVALQRNGQTEDAAKALTRAVELDPQNLAARRNLASALGKQGRHAEAESHFRRALQIQPDDVAGLYGLALCLWKQSKTDEADELFKKVIDSDPASDIAETARTALRQMAEDRFKSKGQSLGGLRMDAVYYCVAAMEMFASMSKAEIQKIAFEIGLLGAQGLSVDDPHKTYELKSMPGKHTGLKLVSFMYVGFKQVAPKEDIGFDLRREYEAALGLFGKKPKA